MLKYFVVAVAIAFGFLTIAPGTVQAQDAKVMAKCRAQVKKIVGNAPGPQQKRQFAQMMKRCVANGGKL